MYKKLLISLTICFSNLTMAEVITPKIEVPLSEFKRPSAIYLSQLPVDGVKPTITRWQTTGYTIIGMLYVAGAVATMRAHAEELNTAFKDHITANPQIESLDKIFNAELMASLKKFEVTTSEISVSYDDDEAVIDPSKTNANLVFTINKLESGFLAAADDKPYVPIVSITFSQIDGALERQKPKLLVVNMKLPADQSVEYENFDLLRADASNAYSSLQKITKAAASQTALTIKGFIMKSQKAAELAPT
jgi:hypothetical protein